MERSDLHRNFGFLIHDVARLMRVAFDRRGRELGLTRSQWWVLTALYAKEGVTQSELAAFMDLEKATLGRLLDRLEEKEWIERRPDRLDRRIKRVYLTDRVQGLMRSLRAIAADIRNDASKGIERERYETFVDTLLQIKANLHAFDELRGPAPETQREAADD
ncbi:MarR family transcriptional regulator [Thalassobaculum sp.]|uniref:MarR family winged helix-turn-helix transcriptional regulator n=2 Tax=Thalassobaculum sp. TaxID=2022740 RepID=UPI0032EB59D2